MANIPTLEYARKLVSQYSTATGEQAERVASYMFDNQVCLRVALAEVAGTTREQFDGVDAGNRRIQAIYAGRP